MIPSLFFANPWGLAALAAVPVLIAIHFLQERSRRVRASTLFLLERAAPLPAGGMRFEKFRNSFPFWMQLLAILAISWLLADPRWVRNDSRQTVVVVLDSSASMEAFREPTLDLLAKRLASWNAVASRTDWHLLETGPGRPPLYVGRDLKELLAAADGWRPTLGTHDPGSALALAETLVPGDAGVVILVTDRATAVPAGVAVLSAGEPFENVGFSRGDVAHESDRLVWRALVTNHGDGPQMREVVPRVLSGDGAPTAIGAPQSIRLESRQTRTVEGPWPEGAERMVLALSEDRFRIDDALPLVRPVPRIVKVAITASGPAADLLGRMVKAAAGVEVVGDATTADLVIGRFDPAAEIDGIQLAIAVDADSDEGGASQGSPERKPVAYDPAWVAAEDHPLTRDLGWGGLMSGPAGSLALSPVDEPLLWKGGKPLVFVRSTVLPGGRRVQNLVLNFDVAGSTAGRSPAVVVLVQRFIDRIRTRIDRPWAGNFETGQVIDVPPNVANGQAGRATIRVAGVDGGASDSQSPFRGRAPWLPSFFAVTVPQESKSTTPLVRGASQFADSRESDFRKAAPVDTLEAIRMEQALKQSITDPWAPLWAGIAVVALLIAWGWRGAKGRAGVDDAPQLSGA
jgi:hypothetical protein